jgi:hypothetical protein
MSEEIKYPVYYIKAASTEPRDGYKNHAKLDDEELAIYIFPAPDVSPILNKFIACYTGNPTEEQLKEMKTKAEMFITPPSISERKEHLKSLGLVVDEEATKELQKFNTSNKP